VRSLQGKAKLARAMADSVESGALHERYGEIGDEAEHAIEVLGDRLAQAYQEAGERGAS